MRITPLDIRHKEFTRSMRGYADVEVDEFLDEITEEFEQLFNENIDYKERLEALEEKISQYKNIEETLKKTLVSAQQQAEELKQNSQKESDLILRDAELKARSITNDAYAERQKIQRSVQALKQKHEDLRYQLRKILDTYANLLEQDVDAFEDVAGLEETDRDSIATDASPVAAGIDEAVSTELMGETESASPAIENIDIDEPRASGLSSLSPAAELDSKEDPFADVEIDTDDDKFKW